MTVSVSMSSARERGERDGIPCCVYAVVHEPTGRIVYIGTARDLKRRWRQHRWAARARKTTWRLHRMMRSLGIDSFCAEPLFFYDNEFDAMVHENFLIRVMKENGEPIANRGCGWRGVIDAVDSNHKRVRLVEDPIDRPRHALARVPAPAQPLELGQRGVTLGACAGEVGAQAVDLGG